MFSEIVKFEILVIFITPLLLNCLFKNAYCFVLEVEPFYRIPLLSQNIQFSNSLKACRPAGTQSNLLSNYWPGYNLPYIGALLNTCKKALLK